MIRISITVILCLAPTVQITHAPDDIAVSSSQVVKFHCRATGKPRAKFTWLDNEERPIISKFRKPRHFKVWK